MSSLGHGVILPRMLGWDIHQDDPYFLSFLVATHLATSFILFFFFFYYFKLIFYFLLLLPTQLISPYYFYAGSAGC